MIRLVLGLVLLTIAANQHPQLHEMRSLFKQAAGQEAAAKQLLHLTAEAKGHPIGAGYHGVANMMMAKHVGNPFKKLSYFKKGKAFFAKAIASDPENLELRFLRFTVQQETPGFLDYKQDLDEDREILLARVHTEKDAELRQMILEYFKASGEDPAFDQ